MSRQPIQATKHTRFRDVRNVPRATGVYVTCMPRGGLKRTRAEMRPGGNLIFVVVLAGRWAVPSETWSGNLIFIVVLAVRGAIPSETWSGSLIVVVVWADRWGSSPVSWDSGRRARARWRLCGGWAAAAAAAAWRAADAVELRAPGRGQNRPGVRSLERLCVALMSGRQRHS